MELILGSIVSFSFLHYATHPKSGIHKKIPMKRMFNFQFSPHINFSLKRHVIHFHHWAIFSPLFVIAQQSDKGILSTLVVKGIFLGAIIQGLMYRDRFKFVFKHQEYNKIRESHYHLDSLLRFWK
jgi:hypothetical protein